MCVKGLFAPGDEKCWFRRDVVYLTLCMLCVGQEPVQHGDYRQDHPHMVSKPSTSDRRPADVSTAAVFAMLVLLLSSGWVDLPSSRFLVHFLVVHAL
jgi:hypothetical protein